jgi:phage protein D
MEGLLVADSASPGDSYTGNFMRPSYLVSVGSEEFSFENEPEVISVKVTRNMGLPTDSCEVYLIGSEDYSFKKADVMKIQLGYDDEMEPVFSGLVENISYEVNRVRVNALGFGVQLLRLRFNRVYLSQTAGKIVKDIALEAGVAIGKASDGISFPTYVVDDASDAYEHVLKLAERCNFEVYFTEDEKLVFNESGRGNKHSLRYGQEIIRLAGFDFMPLCTSANIFGESPSSVKGSDTYHWLTKQEVKGEAGSGPVLTIHDPAVRDKKTAENVAKARIEKLGYTFGLAVETVGKPQIKLGDTVTLEEVPNSALTDQLEVRSFEHYLSKSKGFTTVLSCWRGLSK